MNKNYNINNILYYLFAHTKIKKFIDNSIIPFQWANTDNGNPI